MIIMLTILVGIFFVLSVLVVEGNPASTDPYIAFWNSPFQISVDDTKHDDYDPSESENVKRDPLPSPDQCPLTFPISWTYRSHRTMHTPPILMTPNDHHQRGKSLLFTTDYEYLDRITPSTTNMNSDCDNDYPLLLEGSNLYYISPTVYTNDNNKEEAIMVNYDGDLLFVELDYDNDNKNSNDSHDSSSRQQRSFIKYPLPSLSVRRKWVTEYISSLQETNEESEHNGGIDPLHSFFELQYNSYDFNGRKVKDNESPVIQSANVLHQSPKRLQKENSQSSSQTKQQLDIVDEKEDRSNNNDPQQDTYHGQDLEDTDETYTGDFPHYMHDDGYLLEQYYKNVRYRQEEDSVNEYVSLPPHVLSNPTLFEQHDDEVENSHDAHFSKQDPFLALAVSYYIDEDKYYTMSTDDSDDKTEKTYERGQYISSALLVFNLRSFRLVCSQQLDLSTDYSTPPVDRATHLDHPLRSLTNNNDDSSKDQNQKMIALALASPTVADIDGNGFMDIVIPTSMGRIYVYHMRNGLYLTPSNTDDNKFPIQMLHPIEKSVLIEDVLGDENLELFALDNGLNLICFNHKGDILWKKSFLRFKSAEVVRLSGMVMGDVDGDGNVDIVFTAQIQFLKTDLGEENVKNITTRLYVVQAKTGELLSQFYPLDIKKQQIVESTGENVSSNDTILLEHLPEPLLVDLHEYQGSWTDKMHPFRNKGNKYHSELDSPPFRKYPRKMKKIPHGGIGKGLHIVQPVQTKLFIIEGATGCTQKMNTGDQITSMVQVDDVHGNGNLDLVITTRSGEIMTLEVSDKVPYHPLNLWNHGSSRSRQGGNNMVHGYSASSGMFIHRESHKYNRDISGLFVDVTFEIFDARPNIHKEHHPRKYYVEVRLGTSTSQIYLQKSFNATGVYSEQVYIPNGPGFYTLTFVMKTTHSLIYEDSLQIAYNTNYTEGMLWIILLPFILFLISLFIYREKYSDEDNNNKNSILDYDPKKEFHSKKWYTFLGRH